MKRILLTLSLSCLMAVLMAQENPVPPVATPYSSGLKVNIDASGDKYFRLITWHQFWAATPVDFQPNATPQLSLRRSRMLMYAQLTDRILILTHFGLNNLNAAGLHPTGQSSQTQLFMHDAWVEYRISKSLYMGGGLHYWNGISRLNNQSTLNIMPLDNPRFAWATLGTSDQFARHLGVYAKGTLFERLQYRFSWNQPMTQSVDQLGAVQATDDNAAYLGTASNPTGKAQNAYAGYVNYQFFDVESNKLPYMVGSYLGSKKVLSLGGGFFIHPGGTVTTNPTGESQYISHDVVLYAADVNLDLPLSEGKTALNVYAGYFNYDFGPNYRLGGTSSDVASSQTLYTQVGYLLPSFSQKIRLQPYATASTRSIDALDGDRANEIMGGVNLFINQHNAKISLQYGHQELQGNSAGRVILQAHIFL